MPPFRSNFAPWVRHLHWLVFVLVACALALIYLHGWSPRGTALRANAKWAHTQFGMAILLVMLPRLLVRARHPGAPPISPTPPRWQLRIATGVHVVLYALLCVTPVLGIATMATKGHAWDFLGIPLPALAAPDQALSKRLEAIHSTFGNVLMYLAAAHAAAALVHHWLQRDDTLGRMLPRARRRG